MLLLKCLSHLQPSNNAKCLFGLDLNYRTNKVIVAVIITGIEGKKTSDICAPYGTKITDSTFKDEHLFTD